MYTVTTITTADPVVFCHLKGWTYQCWPCFAMSKNELANKSVSDSFCFLLICKLQAGGGASAAFMQPDSLDSSGLGCCAGEDYVTMVILQTRTLSAHFQKSIARYC